MANTENQEVKFTVKGVDYTMRFGSYAVAQMERALDMSMYELALELENPHKRRMATLGVALWAGLNEFHPEIDERAAFRLLDDGGKEYVGGKLGEALEMAFPDADPKGGDAGNPTPANRQGRRAAAAKTRKKAR